jgi:tetratricopeptide (TPR) repeat protein
MATYGDLTLEELEETIPELREALSCPSSEEHGDDSPVDESEPTQDELIEMLADALYGVYELSGRQSALQEAIDLREAILRGRSANDERRFAALNDFGLTLYRSARAPDYDEARMRRCVTLLREALDVCPSNDTFRDTATDSLVASLVELAEHGGDSQSLKEAISLCRDALVLRPPGCLSRVEALNNLSYALTVDFKQNRCLETVDEAITLLREAIGLCPDEHVSRRLLLNNLYTDLMLRSDHGDDLVSLEEAITVRRNTLELCTEKDPLRGGDLHNLGYALLEGFKRRGGLSTLQEAIESHREALRVSSSDDNTNQITMIQGLANVLLVKFEQQGEPQLLLEAVELYRKVLVMSPMGSPSRITALSNLGNGLRLLYEGQGDLAVLEEATLILREAVEDSGAAPASRDACLTNLANVLLAGFDRGVPNVIEEAIKLYRQGLELRPPGHASHVEGLSNLSNALISAFANLGGLDRLKEAAKLQREALRQCPTHHASRPIVLTNLANILLTLFEQYGEANIIAEAIQLYRDAALLCPPGHCNHFTATMNLAGALEARFDYQGEKDTLAEAVTLLRQAQEKCPPGHHCRETFLGNLASALLVGYADAAIGESLGTLAECVELYRQTSQLCCVEHPCYSFWSNRLALALRRMFERQGDVHNLTESIAIAREALRQCLPESPIRTKCLISLASSLEQESACQGHAETRLEAIELYREALRSCSSADRAEVLSGLGRGLLIPNGGVLVQDYLAGVAHMSEALTNELSSARQRLRNVVIDLRCVEKTYATLIDLDLRALLDQELLNLYISAVHLLPRVANFGLDERTRLEAITGSDELSRNAAARALQLRRVSEAVVVLEEGRGIFWSQTLNLKNPIFAGVPEEDRANLARLLSVLNRKADVGDARVAATLASRRDRDVDTRRRLNQEAEGIIAKIRRHAGLERFLMPPSFEGLMRSLPEGYVIVLNASHLGNHALLLNRALGLATSLQLDLIPTTSEPNFTTLRSLLPRTANSAPSHPKEHEGNRAMAISKKRPINLDLDEVLSRLWTRLVHPVIVQLGLKVSIISPYAS